MEWGIIFSAANGFALIAWGSLIILPRWPFLLSAILYLGVGLLCLVYTVCLGAVLSGAIPTDNVSASFTTLEGVRSIFVSDVGVTIGWIHYLAFDLFVGLWIARDADAKFISRFIQGPSFCLPLWQVLQGSFYGWSPENQQHALKAAGNEARIRRFNPTFPK